MLYKRNESRHHKIRRTRYKVTNWREYNNALRLRRDFTIWFTEEAIAKWCPAETGARDHPQEYSVVAVECRVDSANIPSAITPNRRPHEFASACHESIPDFSTASERNVELPRLTLDKAMESGSIVIVDSTGLKVCGKNEWHQEKHGVPAWRTWRKLHLVIDEKHWVVTCELTMQEVGAPQRFQICLTRSHPPFETFMGDDAYDGHPVSQAISDKQSRAQVIIPPHNTVIALP